MTDRSVSDRLTVAVTQARAAAAELGVRPVRSWPFQSGDDLEARAESVRGLTAPERAWIAASADGSWPDRSPAIDERPSTPPERPVPRPTPVMTVPGIDTEARDTLAEAGITSLERLATIDAATVAEVLDLDVRHVRTWRRAARDALE